MTLDPLDLPATAEWSHITGRGPVAYYDKGVIEWPRQLNGRLVRIDGKVYRVNGVEMYAVPDTHPAIHWGPFGLCVTAAGAEAES